MWACRLRDEELSAIAARLGSDVPLFLGPPSARILGRGQLVEPVPLCPFAAVLLTPPVQCPTAEVYRAYDAMGARPLESFDPAPLASEKPTDWPELLRNDLFPAACRICPALSAYSGKLAADTGLPVHMTGSGSALFVLADDLDQAVLIRRKLDEELARFAQVVLLNPW